MTRPETARPALLWLRRDLRLHDNAALAAAVASGRPVLPVYVLDDDTPGAWRMGAASRWWLHHSLAALQAELQARGAPLVLRRGPVASVLPALVAETGAAEIHAGKPGEPWARTALAGLSAGVPVHLHRTQTLHSLDGVRTQTGTPYGVFTPYSRACRVLGPVPPPLAAPAHITAAPAPASDTLEDWGLLPSRPDWAGGLRASWQPGEPHARRQLAEFVAGGVQTYDALRDRPGMESTSRLSPALHFGEISARAAWQAAAHTVGAGGNGVEKWHNELLWREFSAHLLFHAPGLPERPLKPAFAAMPWRDDPAQLRAWQRGETGVPIVDAGMRQLWQTGWMHNRVRMIVASFLVKHLLLPWQAGAAWFWDTLVDADLASNSASWQWVAGCGADAAPYFRIFNPVLQGAKFDPEGTYVRRYVPELARLPAQVIHAPWDAPALVLRASGVSLGGNYPAPIVDLAAGRQRALDALASISKGQP